MQSLAPYRDCTGRWYDTSLNDIGDVIIFLHVTFLRVTETSN